MGVDEVFRRSFRAADAAGPSTPELMPARLAAACAAVLPADGAGLSAFTPDGFRIPLGASDDFAAAAERLQFTLGEGPCLLAHRERRTVLADQVWMRGQWPMFHAQLTARTPYRAVVAVPLGAPFGSVGSLDLMLHSPEIPADLNLDDVAVVATEMSRILLTDSVFAGESAPTWTRGSAAARRRWVFIACGILNVDLGITTGDSLAVLRGYASRTDRALDDVADDVAHRRITADELRAPP